MMKTQLVELSHW